MRVYQGAWLIVATFLFVTFRCARRKHGRITDPTGSVIVNATVKAVNADTGVRSTAQTNANGDFLLPFLIPGPYSLAVEAPGFQHFTIDMALKIG